MQFSPKRFIIYDIWKRKEQKCRVLSVPDVQNSYFDLFSEKSLQIPGDDPADFDYQDYSMIPLVFCP